MNAIFQRTCRALATLAVLAIAIDGLAAQKLYATAYRNTGADIRVRLRWPTNQLNTEVASLAAQGFRIMDINSYRDTAGAVRHDATLLAFSGAYRFYTDLSEADLVGTTSSLVSQGFELNTFSSYANNDGTRVYAANYLQGASGGRMHIGQTRTDFLNSYASNIASGERLTAFDTYTDTSGVRRYDSLFVQAFNETQSVALGMTRAQFETRRVTELQNGRRMWMFKAYFDSANAPRFDAVYRDATVLQPTRLFFAESEAQLTAQVQTQASQGFKLTDIEPTFLGTLPERNLYGTGLAGTSAVPDLTMTDAPTLGRPNSLRIRANSGQSTIGLLATGLAPIQTPLLGGTLLVDPSITQIVVLPTNLETFNVSYPGDPVFDGARLYYQMIIVDGGAIQGYSMSRGLEAVIGRQD